MCVFVFVYVFLSLFTCLLVACACTDFCVIVFVVCKRIIFLASVFVSLVANMCLGRTSVCVQYSVFLGCLLFCAFPCSCVCECAVCLCVWLSVFLYMCLFSVSGECVCVLRIGVFFLCCLCACI